MVYEICANSASAFLGHDQLHESEQSACCQHKAMHLPQDRWAEGAEATHQHVFDRGEPCVREANEAGFALCVCGVTVSDSGEHGSQHREHVEKPIHQDLHRQINRFAAALLITVLLVRQLWATICSILIGGRRVAAPSPLYRCLGRDEEPLQQEQNPEPLCCQIPLWRFPGVSRSHQQY